FAEREKMIVPGTLVGIKKPTKASRGEWALIAFEDHVKLCENADPLFRAYLQLLWHTGARPGEIACLTADHVDLEQSICDLFDEHKTAHMGKSRTIFLSPEAKDILRERVAECPTGLLFPGEFGQRLSSQAIG